MSESFLNGKVVLHCGDMLAVVPTLEENSIDSCVCDPPYHLQSITKRFAKTGHTDKTRTTSGPHQRTANGFMNKMWDGGDVAFRVETWGEVYRVLKPGAYVVAFSSTRTFGRMSVAIEDSGFITHPFIAWMFGQGFPKAHRVHNDDWEGWRYGTQSLKPAIEPIYVGQKPFEKGLTGTENVIKWGTGALNIDGCRVEWAGMNDAAAAAVGFAESRARGTAIQSNSIGKESRDGTNNYDPFGLKGRWPANVILSDDDEVRAAFPDAPGQQQDIALDAPSARTEKVYGKMNRHGEKSADARYSGKGSTNFAALPGMRRGDEGSAARFFYTAKADADDRLGSKHPTVKPLDLIQYLVRLVTPPRGLVLDCFAGTGTTGEAAYREGFSAVLIEREAEYQDDIRRRMKLCLSGPDERARESIKARLNGKPQDHGPLFGGTSEMTRGGGRQIYGHFADQDERSDQRD